MGSPDSHLVYHGSHEDFLEAIPKRQIRCRDGQVIFDQVSFHATAYRHIALAYTCGHKPIQLDEKTSTQGMGVSLYENNFEVAIYGAGGTLEERLSELYGSGGYLLGFDPKDFSHIDGLGPLEVATLKPARPVTIELIPDPVADMLKAGVRFRFIDILKEGI